jgi:hypothetical protein
MTDSEMRQIAAYLHELRKTDPPPLPSPHPVGAGTYLLGFLMICLTLIFWPELRGNANGAEQWLAQQAQWLRQLLGS